MYLTIMRDIVRICCARHNGHIVKHITSPITIVEEAFKALLSRVEINISIPVYFSHIGSVYVLLHCFMYISRLSLTDPNSLYFLSPK